MPQQVILVIRQECRRLLLPPPACRSLPSLTDRPNLRQRCVRFSREVSNRPRQITGLIPFRCLG